MRGLPLKYGSGQAVVECAFDPRHTLAVTLPDTTRHYFI